ncbi:MAG: peptidoglycan-binding protein [Peptococcaceae bacterium]|nr:peptidoglycan-binding protein [Peptococcaceae bacterium]MDH7524395.1 peptidoglycan-binding protein [Peptococcaceae bacterium]
MQYIVQPGDTLYIIAQKFGVSVEALVQANNITNPDLIFTGQVLTIPKEIVPSPAPAPSPPTAVCPPLSRGSRGPFVRKLQTLLLNRGISPGPVDGIFGSGTEAAVKRFQAQAGLSVTGVVDVSTWTALGVNCGVIPPAPPVVPPVTPPQQHFCPILRLGAVGPAVRLLQRLLRERGFYRGPIDGDFGGRTQQAVREFQRRQGLAVTGVVNEATWEALGVECHKEPRPPAGTPIATTVARGIRHILYTDRRVYGRGEKVKITLVKTNVTDDEITLRYSTSQIIEITVTSGVGTVVWKYSEGRQFSQFTRIITIYPGGTQVINEEWNQRNNAGVQVPPGTYTITVENLATGASLSVQVTIR